MQRSPARPMLVAYAILLSMANCFGVSLHAQNTYNVSQQYGYSTTDNTAFLQQALNDPTAAVIVIDDLQGTLWRTDGLLLTRSNVRIEFAAGVVLEAIPGVLEEFESLLNIRGASNVFVEGNGATMRMDKLNYPRTSQFRHCILTRGPQNVTIQNLSLIGAAGDGIEVGPDFVVDVNDVDGDGDITDIEPVVPSQGITLNNLICDDNNRQGMSVVSVVGLTVNGCTFSNTDGAEPESGVDFEPFKRYQPMQGIVMTGCTFSGNHGNGIQFGGVDIDASSPPSDILIQNALVFGNGQSPTRRRAGVDINNVYNPFAGSDQTQDPNGINSAPGTFTLLNSTVRDEPYPGINVRQYASGLTVNMTNVTVENCANTFVNLGLGPIIVQPVNYTATANNEPCFGNVAFTNVTLLDDQLNRAQVTVNDFRAGPTGPADVIGNIDVTLTGAAAGGAIDYNQDSDDCGNFTLTVTSAAPLPVQLSAFTAREVDCEHSLNWQVESADQLVAFVLEARHDGEGWRKVREIATTDDEALGEHRVALDGRKSSMYRLASVFEDGTVSYSDVAFVSGCDADGELRVWPNPNPGRFNITPSPRDRCFEISNALGQVINYLVLPAGATVVDLGSIMPGLYVLTSEDGSNTRLVVE